MFQSQQEGGDGPSLRIAGEPIVFAVEVGELWQTHPVVMRDVVNVVLKHGVGLLLGEGLPEVGHSHNVEPVEPQPLRAVVVAKSKGLFQLRTVYFVVVLLPVQRLMDFVQSSHSERIRLNESFFHVFDVGEGMLRVYKLGTQRQSDEGVRSQPVLFLGQVGGHRDILVDPPSLDVSLLNGGVSVSTEILRDPKPLLKVGFDVFGPLFVSKISAFERHRRVLEIPLLMQLVVADEVVVQQTHEFDRTAISASSWKSFGLSDTAHFVHPGETVPSIAPNNESCIRMYPQVDVESLR